MGKNTPYPKDLYRFGVYMIRNKINNRFYIGSTKKSFGKRWRNHLYLLENGDHHNRRVQFEYDKYGKDALEFTVLLFVDNPCDVMAKEQEFIDKYWKDTHFLNASERAERPVTCAKMRIALPERDALENLYVEQKKSTVEIARIFKCNYLTVAHRLKKHGIPIRSPSEYSKLNWEKYPESFKRGHEKRVYPKYGKLKTGGRFVDGHGFVRIMMKDHPAADSKGYVLEHILVYERITQKNFKRGEIIFHINGDKLDSDPKNLMHFDSLSEFLPYISARDRMKRKGIVVHENRSILQDA